MTDLILVDENDNELGTMEKLKAHELALLHRAFSVMLYRQVGAEVEVLLQQRAADKYHCPGIWANTCCSHPLPGEQTEAGAHRRLKEEVNLAVDLTYAGHFIYKASFDNGLTEHELDHVFIGEYTGDMPVFNQAEIASMQWRRLSDVKHALEKRDAQFAPWLSGVVRLLEERLNHGKTDDTNL